MPNCDEGPPPDDRPGSVPTIEVVDVVVVRQPPAESIGPVDLMITAGEWVTLTGEGAPGLAHVLSGAAAPDRGTVRIGGHHASSSAAAAAVSTMADPLELDDAMTLLEHLEAAAGDAPAHDWRSDVDDLVGRLDMEDRLDDRIFTFSRGMRQKTAVCMAFVREFDIAILHEPFGGLDRRGRSQVLALLSDAHAQGCTVVIVGDDPHALAVGGRVVTL